MKATATLHFEDGWWQVAVTLGDHTFHTQGRNLREARAMIADVLTIARDEPDLPTPDPDPILVFADDVAQATTSVKTAQRDLERAQTQVNQRQRSVVHDLRQKGLKLADIAELLGLTKGRISQLAKA
ncbi:MAG: sigma factor-like helix-turn-helix DNA-binding protein [Actinomycetaceae bacterium]|nr:hypothetical protein [Arcanobacterium sp.]MDD7686453.1 sigma factor-like helix-turn-helix DNA-binding protein [Actinomycetaceae bacterium]MDY5272733.1 sigma factor-like helix-turn-helix DNA-binding protein [Arcanobacterium sp.]